MAKKINLEKELLYRLYIIEEKSIRKISSELGYTTHVIHTNLKDYNINRNQSEAQKVKCNIEGVHNQFKLDSKTLKELYINQNLTPLEISVKLGCSKSKVYTSLKNLNINKNLSEAMKGKEPWNKGKIGVQKHSVETKRKIRLATLNRIEETILNNGQLYPAYNIKSIPIIEEYGDKYGFNFQHAENGGEYKIEGLGYWVDGYDSKNNVVLEFDEVYHTRQKEKDLIRQEEIINHLRCQFIRIDENGNEILNIK